MAEGAIPTALYSSMVLASGSAYIAARALSSTINTYSILPHLEKGIVLYNLTSYVNPIVDNRVSVDGYFRLRFNKKLFEPTVDDAKAVLDMSLSCADQTTFVSRVLSLSGFLSRLNPKIKDLIADQATRQEITGSINVLERVLSERFPNYNPAIIGNLRKINILRSQLYPTHVTTPEAIELIQELGFQYPLENWNDLWIRVLNLAEESLRELKALFI